MTPRDQGARELRTGSPKNVILVITSVHHPDDPRIRERTVRALSTRASVRFATQIPGPLLRDDHEWVPLPGGRLLRLFAAFRAAFARDVTFVSIHDPELVPVGLLVRLLRRIPVVYDVHEDISAQIMNKEWLPRPLRPLIAGLARIVVLSAEATLTMTLAEDGYHRNLRRRHVVLPNYPDVDRLPAPADDERYIIYVGDIREVRGAVVAVEAVGAMQHALPLVMVGRCAQPLREKLARLSTALEVELTMTGFLPHEEAMARVAGATVGMSPLLDIPNYRHSLPTKVLEYLALGMPVVASDLPGTASVVGELDTVLLVPPGDSVELAGALDRVVADPAHRERANSRAQEMRERFSWPTARLLEVYGLDTSSR